MRHDAPGVPIYIKTTGEMPWPAGESVFYVLSGNGLFLCRNHPLFRSSVPAPAWPAGLAFHERSLSLTGPMVPRRLFELVVGFFSRVADRHAAEAGALLTWRPGARRLGLVVPDQVATVSVGERGGRYPVDLRYDGAGRIPGGSVVVGDIHSHVDMPAYASATDREDEQHRPGLHVVVGRISSEPPEIHCEFVVDGARFPVPRSRVLEGYNRRRTGVPAAWLEKVRVVTCNGGGGW